MNGKLYHNHPLVKYTTWHVGGNADRFYQPSDLNDLQSFLKTLDADEPLTWLGLGSNTLIRDGGIRGTVILTLKGLSALEQLPNGLLRVEAGVPCAKLAKYCVKQNLTDGAFFAGIPGTVGGALRMNAGAFGGETWPTVEAVETINHAGEICLRQKSEFKIGYREVHGLANGEYFIAGHFKLNPGDGIKTKQEIKDLLQRRADTQPVGTFNCGSVFRNPPGDHAARLIESCGLKGYKIGGAEVSTKHANFIINNKDATAKELEELINFVQNKVAEKTGVQLIRECIFLGEEENSGAG